MKRFFREFIRISLIYLLLVSAQVMAQDAHKVTPGIIRIKISEKLATAIESQTLRKSANGIILTTDQEINLLNAEYQVSDMHRLYPDAGKFEKRHREFGLHLWYELHCDQKAVLADMVKKYQANSQVILSEPVYQKKNAGTNMLPKGIEKNMYNDPEFEKQWHYFNNNRLNSGVFGNDIWLQNAWTIETGKDEVIVAILDGGVDTDHIDLAKNMWVNSHEVPGNGIDDDENGYVDDINGYNFVTNTDEIVPGDHGTHVAGVVAATNNNGVGVSGIAGGSGNDDGARLMSCEIFEGNEQADNIGAAFAYAADNGAVIAQNSWGYSYADVYEQAVLDGIDYFVQHAGYDANNQPTGPIQGGLVFFASGNDGATGNWWPGCYENVIAVGSTDANDHKSDFTNYGTWVDICAPGGSPGIYSTVRNNRYEIMMGTSMACPHVSGVAALMVSNNIKNITRDALIEKLLTSTDPIDNLNPGFESKIGSGRLNAYRALISMEDDGYLPNSINDLIVVDSTSISVFLSWTAPGRGEQNSGSVTNYDIRFSEQEITNENFELANKAHFRHAQPSGLTEVAEVKNLLPGRKYYFAVKSMDTYENISTISNQVVANTLQAPYLDVQAFYKDTVNRNYESSGFVEIGNIGQKKLGYYASVEYGYWDTKNWIKIENAADSIEVGETINLDLNYDLSVIEDGIHKVTIKIKTNDPFHSNFEFGLDILVHGNQAMAILDQQSVEFGDVYVGTRMEKTLLLKNSIDAKGFLQVSSTLIEDTDFSVLSSLPMFVAPGDSASLVITYAPNAEETISETLEIFMNDMDLTSATFTLNAKAVLPPEIFVNATSVEAEVEKGESYEYTFNIENTGADKLSVNFMLENLTNLTQNQEISETMVLNEIYAEDFENEGLPEGWSLTTLGIGWTFSSDYSSTNFSIPDHTRYAVVNDDYSGESNNGTEDYLITPEINLNYIDSAVLTFDSYFTADYGMKAYVKISIDNGENWLTLKSLSGASNWENIQVDLSQFINNQVLIAFHANDQGLYASGWAIDNVKIETNANWVDVVKVSGNNEILPSEQNEYKLKLNSSLIEQNTYLANLHVLSNDPFNTDVIIPITFKVFDAQNVFLSTLLVDGVALDNFDPNQFIYEVSVEGIALPFVEAAAQNPYANVHIQQATDLNGELQERTATITVTSNDESTSKQYLILFSKVLSINDEMELLNVYPNPFTNQLHFNLPINTTGNISISLIDVSGKVVLDKKIKTSKFILSTEELAKGFYVITININDKYKLNKSMIKQ